MTVPTREMGPIDLYLIYDYAGVWEEEWRPFQKHPLAALFTRVPHDMVEHAILGFSRPLVKALGLIPEGCLRKLPSRECDNAKACSLYIASDCTSLSKKMPLCFVPAGVEEGPVRFLTTELVRLWRDKVYVTVVEEDPANA